MQNEQNGTPLSDWSIAGISWSRYSSGMMMNSDSHTTLSLYPWEDYALFTADEKLPFADISISTRKIGMQVFAELADIVRQEDLLALCGLEYVQEYMMTDVSSSETVSLTLRVQEPGNCRTVSESIDCRAVRQRGKIDRLDKLFARLFACRLEGEPLEIKTLKGNAGPFMGMGILAAAMAENAAGCWTCPQCGTAENKGKFCGECGTPRP